MCSVLDVNHQCVIFLSHCFDHPIRYVCEPDIQTFYQLDVVEFVVNLCGKRALSSPTFLSVLLADAQYFKPKCFACFFILLHKDQQICERKIMSFYNEIPFTVCPFFLAR